MARTGTMVRTVRTATGRRKAGVRCSPQALARAETPRRRTTDGPRFNRPRLAALQWIPTTTTNRPPSSRNGDARASVEAPRRPGGGRPADKKNGGLFRFVLIAVGLALFLAILVLLGWRNLSHNEHERQQTAQAVQRGAITVRAVKPSLSPPVFDFSLPGSAEAFATATLYARINGYLKTRLVDIGDRVETGQLVAEIDAPDLDAQLLQARAQLEQNRAALGIAQVTFEREKRLLDQKVVAKQEYDTSEATYNQAVANVKAAEANVRNLTAQQGFEKIIAPFPGVITTRNLDTGALIASGGGSGVSIYTEVEEDILRVYINVPQAYIANINVGQEVEVTANDYPQKIFKGKVTRMADALDPTARTERVEIQLPSEQGKLVPGMYLSVRFRVEQNEPALIIPAEAVDIRRQGPRVAVIGGDGKINYRQVKLGRDFGKTIEIVSGLQGNENARRQPDDRPPRRREGGRRQGPAETMRQRLKTVWFLPPIRNILGCSPGRGGRSQPGVPIPGIGGFIG